MKKLAFILLFLPTVVMDQKSIVAADEISVNDVVHCFHYFGDSTITYTFAASNTYYQLTNASNNLFDQGEDDGFSISGDTLTFTFAGDYDLTAKLTIEGGNGVAYTMVFRNITQAAMIPTGAACTGRGAGNFTSINISAYAEDVAAGDKFILMLRNLDNTTEATLKNGTIKARLVHR